VSVQAANSDEDRLATVFAALADPTRLRILGRIAERTTTSRALSESLALTPPTISHHMAKLAQAGLVTVTADRNRRHYGLNQSMLASVGRKAATNSQPGDPRAKEQTGDPIAIERAKVLRDFFDGERLKQIPAQRKKRVFVL
jgi:DNA-binding transcriptional ArsR family regulator